MKINDVNFYTSFCKLLVGICIAVSIIVLLILSLQLLGISKINLNHVILSIVSVCVGVIIGELITLLVESED
jgi:hypothetical protein